MARIINKALKPVNVYYLMAIFVLFATMGGFRGSGINYSDVYREVIPESGFLALLVYWLYSNRKTKQISIHFSWTRVWAIGLFLFATLSIFWVSNLDFYASKHLMWVGSAAVFILTLSLPSDTKTHLIIARALTIIGTYIAVIGLLQSIFLFDLFSQAAPPAANYVNANMAAQVIVLVFPMVIFLLFVDRIKYLLRIYPFILALMLAYIFHGQTQAAWISLSIVILSVIVALTWYRKRYALGIAEKKLFWDKTQILTSLLALILLIILVNVSSTGYTPFWQELTGGVEAITERAASPQEAFRFRIWRGAYSMIEQNPIIGSGMGTFFYNVYTQTTTMAVNLLTIMRTHSDPLELTVELGVVGLMMFLAMTISLLFNILKTINHDKIKHQLFYVVIGAGLFGSFANMQVSFPYQMPASVMIFGLYLALIIKGTDALTPNIKTFKINLQAKHWYMVTGLTSVVFAIVAFINITWLSVFSDLNQGLLKNRWKKPEIFLCHKLVVKLVGDTAGKKVGSGQYRNALPILELLNQCIPNTWFYEYQKGISLLQMQHKDEAIKTLELARVHHPKGIYVDYLNLFAAYARLGQNQKALQIYQDLLKEPEELLIKKPETLRFLVETSLIFKDTKKAVKYYQLYLKNHGENARLKVAVQQYL